MDSSNFFLQMHSFAFRSKKGASLLKFHCLYYSHLRWTGHLGRAVTINDSYSHILNICSVCCIGARAKNTESGQAEVSNWLNSLTWTQITIFLQPVLIMFAQAERLVLSFLLHACFWGLAVFFQTLLLLHGDFFFLAAWLAVRPANLRKIQLSMKNNKHVFCTKIFMVWTPTGTV